MFGREPCHLARALIQAPVGPIHWVWQGGSPLRNPSLIDRQTFEQTVEVPAGGYAYWYIRGAPVGLSIQAADVDLKEHHQVLLMRLR